MLSLEEHVETLKSLDSDIMDQLIEKDADDREVEKEAEEANEVQDKIISAKTCLQDLQSRNSNKEKGTPESPREREGSGQAIRRVRAILPKLELKNFAGNVAQWQQFWGAFKSSIHNDKELANVDKFKYLRSLLE